MKKGVYLLIMSLLLFAEPGNAQDNLEGKSVHTGKKVVYHLYVRDTTTFYNGKKAKGISINGSIPGPTLYFTIGDTAEVHVHNMMHMEGSIHWHGLILPNEQDGVPYLTTAPIKSHSTHVYRFPVVQTGTYWYHSHSMLQEQSGMYGAIVIRDTLPQRMQEHVVLLSDWTNEVPEQVERSLHYATDWYAIKKGATQDYLQSVKEGKFGVKLQNEWKRMMAMDVSDVYYDNMLVNGKIEDRVGNVNVGDSIRLRIINGSSSTYFWVQYSGGKMTVVATDGAAVQPVEVDRFIVGVSETYDVIITRPDSGSYTLLATAEDRTKSTSLVIGDSPWAHTQQMPRLKYFEGMKMMNGMMRMNGSMNDMGMNMSLQQMDMNTVMYPEITDSNKSIVTLNYSMLKAPKQTTLPDAATRTFLFELTGNMNRYVWTMNNITISESDKILIKKGENIRIVIYNNSMMRHPMHLHGHFFRVLNGQGDFSPLKTVLDVMPMETDTIEFHASEDYGDWYFHCHILYHMMSGMGRIFRYENTPPNSQLPDEKKALRKVYRDDRRFYLGGQIGVESNGSDGEIMLSNTRWLLQSEWRIGLNKSKGYESETHIGRLIGRNQWLYAYTGFDWRYRKHTASESNLFGQQSTKDERAVICAGVQYTLPMLLKTDLRVDMEGNLRMQLFREDIPLAKRLRMNFLVNTDKEYTVGLRYIVTKYFSASTHYDSDMGYGVGLTVTY